MNWASQHRSFVAYHSPRAARMALAKVKAPVWVSLSSAGSEFRLLMVFDEMSIVIVLSFSVTQGFTSITSAFHFEAAKTLNCSPYHKNLPISLLQLYVARWRKFRDKFNVMVSNNSRLKETSYSCAPFNSFLNFFDVCRPGRRSSWRCSHMQGLWSDPVWHSWVTLDSHRKWQNQLVKKVNAFSQDQGSHTLSQNGLRISTLPWLPSSRLDKKLVSDHFLLKCTNMLRKDFTRELRCVA